MNSSALWLNIPSDLRAHAQWMLAGPDRQGKLKVPSVARGARIIPADNTSPANWLPFEQATAVAAARNLALGYVLAVSDPFCCIDLDVKNQANEPDPSKWTTQEQLDRHRSIVQALDSYTERSQSGQGLHVWVKGKIGRGRKRDHVEVYSQERFIVCTGNVLIDRPIEDRQAMLDNAIRQMPESERGKVTLIEVDPELTDDELWRRAANADNSSKFISLCEARWEALGYPSSSEADFALLAMLAFYSPSNAQCRRMFRQTVLAKRPGKDHMTSDRLIDLALSQIRARQAREAEVEASVGKSVEAMIQRMLSRAS